MATQEEIRARQQAVRDRNAMNNANAGDLLRQSGWGGIPSAPTVPTPIDSS